MQGLHRWQPVLIACSLPATRELVFDTFVRPELLKRGSIVLRKTAQDRTIDFSDARTSSRGDDAHLSLNGAEDLNYCAYVHVENILLA